MSLGIFDGKRLLLMKLADLGWNHNIWLPILLKAIKIALQTLADNFSDSKVDCHSLEIMKSKF